MGDEASKPRVDRSGPVAGRDVRQHGENVAGRDQTNIEQLNITLRAAEAAVTQPLYQLPRDVSDFTDREDELLELVGALDRQDEAAAAVTVITAVAGKPGVGKSALAIRAAHQVKAAFPDAQLYVNLRGPEGERLAPLAVLDGFLRQLGIPLDDVPADIEARAAAYRSQLAARRVLVVLDNAADEEQVRPLLPGSDTCAVLITSRSRLDALEGADVAELDVLDTDWAIVLLRKLADAERVDAEPEAAERIVALCGRLPLALRIAGAKLRARKNWTLAKVANLLGDEHRVLDQLKLGDQEVRASFTMSYYALQEPERKLFRRLGVLPVADFAEPVAAVLMDDAEDAGSVLERLVDAQLLESPSADRYRFHDLLRIFARERLTEEEPGDAQVEIKQAAFKWFTLLAQSGGAALRGDQLPVDDDEGARDALFVWIQREQDNLRDVFNAAFDAREWDAVVQIAIGLEPFWNSRGDWAQANETLTMAVEAARQVEDPRDLPHILFLLGHAQKSADELDAALASFIEAIDLVRVEGSDRLAEASVLDGTGVIYALLGRTDDALRSFADALAISEAESHRGGQSRTRNNRGMLYRKLGKYDEAIQDYEQALELARADGDRRAMSFTYNNIGVMRSFQGRFEEAIDAYREDLRICLAFKDLFGAATTLRNIALAEGKRGNPSGVGVAMRDAGWLTLELGDHLTASGDAANALSSFAEIGDEAGVASVEKLAAAIDAARPSGREPAR